MNDLEMINTLRSDVAPDPAALNSARAALLERAAAETPRTRWRMPLPKVVLAATSVVAVAAAVIVVVPSSGTASAASVLAQAAQSASTAPGADTQDRYVYIDTTTYIGGVSTPEVERWVPMNATDRGLVRQADGTSKQFQYPADPACSHALVVTSPTGQPQPTQPTTTTDLCQVPLVDPSYTYLNGLPTDTAALRAIVYQQSRQLGGVIGVPEPLSAFLTAYPPNYLATYPPDQGAYALIADVVVTSGLPSRTLAALLRVAATIPGVSVDHHVVDAIGRPGVGLRRSLGQDWTELILDENSHQVLGLETMLKGTHDAVVLRARGFTSSTDQRLPAIG